MMCVSAAFLVKREHNQHTDFVRKRFMGVVIYSIGKTTKCEKIFGLGIFSRLFLKKRYVPLFCWTSNIFPVSAIEHIFNIFCKGVKKFLVNLYEY